MFVLYDLIYILNIHAGERLFFPLALFAFHVNK
jgi:hypothetical protein